MLKRSLLSLVFSSSLLLPAAPAVAQSGVLDLTRALFVTEAEAGANPQEGDELGSATAVGDFNGDGFEDFASGAPFDTEGRGRTRRWFWRSGPDPRSGAVTVFPGSERGITTGSLLSQRLAGDVDEEGDLFGAAMTVGDFNFDGFEDLAVGAPGETSGMSGPRAGAVYIFPGGPFGLRMGFRLTEADAGGVEGDGDEFGAAMATGDVDGDGFEDLVVGAPGDAPDGGVRSGAVYIFPGSHNGLGTLRNYAITQADVMGEVGEEGDRFGAAIETGQFNGFGGVDVGDGFADLAVGAPGEAPGADPASGAVFLFLGTRDGIGPNPGFSLTQADVGGTNEAGDLFGAEMGVGDSNNDGVEELAVGAPGKNQSAGTVIVFVADPAHGITLEGFPLVQENAGGVSEPGDRFGAGLAFGVLDQNGLEELAVGAPGEDGDTGIVFVFPGTDAGLGAGFSITQEDAGGVSEPGDRFGAALSIEDFNDNNAADIAAGAPGDAPRGLRTGSVFVFPGLPVSPPATTQEAAGGVLERGDLFAAAQASGDFNGDGFQDLAVGSPGEDLWSGAVSIFPGSAAGGAGISTGFTITQRAAGDRDEAWDRFGSTFAVGDFDGDGFDDLAVGAPGEDAGAGAVFVFPGSDAGITTGFFLTETRAGSRNLVGEWFGGALSAGDFNGDGFSDLAVGAPNELHQTGAVFLFPGSPAGIRLGFFVTQVEAGDFSDAGDRFGAALASGDFDEDGFDDLAVGAPAPLNLKPGAVFVFPGTVFGIRTGFFFFQTHAGGELGLRDEFGAALATGDFEGDGFADLAVGAPSQGQQAGAVSVFPGSSRGLGLGYTLTETIFGERFGAALAVGDGDGDGFDDLVVGAPNGRALPFLQSGLAFVFPGSEQGVQQSLVVEQAGNGGSNEVGDLFGFSLAFEDFDGDGLADLSIGAPGETPDKIVGNIWRWESRSGALFLIDDLELERLFDEFRRLQQTNDPLPPL